MQVRPHSHWPLLALLGMVACGGAQPTPEGSATNTSDDASPRQVGLTASAEKPPDAAHRAPSEEKGLPSNLESEPPPQASQRIAIPKNTSLSMWVDTEAIRASTLKATAEKLIAALPTTPTLFTDGGISTVESTDTLFIANETGHTMAFYVLAKTRGGSPGFEKRATAAGTAHGTPLVWVKQDGVRHAVFKDARGPRVALASWNRRHISISRAEALDELRSVAPNAAALLRLPKEAIVVLELDDARSFTRVNDARLPTKFSLQVRPQGKDYSLHLDAAFESEIEATDALKFYRSQIEQLAKRVWVQMLLNNILKNMKFEQTGSSLTLRTRASQNELRGILIGLTGMLGSTRKNTFSPPVP